MKNQVSADEITPSGYVIGIDVGSTTVKAVVVNAKTQSIVWQAYRRHETRQAEHVLAMLEEILQQFSDDDPNQFRLFVTGSGAAPLAKPLGARFVQEVNAVTLAVEKLHPDVGSVVELGGQDAKIIIFTHNLDTGEKQVVTSMNDKCASGTGATIDKCLIKVGLSEQEVAALDFDPYKLHKVAAKCGVFAETDIVNLVKSGIPSAEVICSLADAIVMQNLSVLTRGNTLKHKVLLLGGPNTYLPFLQQAWRLRIGETWQQRGYQLPDDQTLEQLVFVPDNAQYYAAFGAVVFGLDEPAGVGHFAGLEALTRYCQRGRGELLAQKATTALVNSESELAQFQQQYQIPVFQPVQFAPGSVVKGYIGLDGGSTSSKAVLLSEDKSLIAKAYRLSEGNPIQDMKGLLSDLKQQIAQQGAELEVLGFGATGYAADVLEDAVKSDVNLVETVAHTLSCLHFFGEIDVICDVGGQDIKVLLLQRGEIKNFRLSNQCSAGNGMLLQAMADQFGVPLTEYANTAFKARLAPEFSYGCAVFLDTDRVNFQKEGFNAEELLAGLAKVLPKNIWQYVVQIPRMAELGTRYVLQGGTQYNLAAVKAQVDYIHKRVPGAQIFVHPHTGEAGAIGAALETQRQVAITGQSSFIGLDAAMNLSYSTKNDASTVCHFCANLCPRTFIDTQSADGSTSRYIAGFSCEKGTVESKQALKALVIQRNQLKKQYVNLCEYESRLLFRSFYQPEPQPLASSIINVTQVTHRWFGKSRIKTRQRLFQRSTEQWVEKRKTIRIAIPKVLNIWSTAPLWRSYFEALGISCTNIIFSDDTSETMWKAGGKYGSIDPCYPSKVIQAHYHQLLFKRHKKKPLHYIFNPTITHLPSFVEELKESTSCPVVSGSPCVTHAAFTKEQDYFAQQGVEHLFDAVNLQEPTLLMQQMFDMWGHRLGVTQDESNFAMQQAWQAMAAFDTEMQARGLELLQQAEENSEVVLLLLARPYHLDPGLNHGVLESFQAQGYPVLSIRSIPKDPSYLARWFNADDTNAAANALSVSDVWPENYSTNSVQKLWAAKFAARHPNVAVLDLSSFKCGHDAPTYALIDNVIKASKTPYMALHDIDANKSAGSLGIRVKTFCHTLARVKQELKAKAQQQSELERRVAAKRNQLYQLLQQQHAAPKLETQRSLNEAFAHYLNEQETVKGVAPSLTEEVAPEMTLVSGSGTIAPHQRKGSSSAEDPDSNIYQLDPWLGASSNVKRRTDKAPIITPDSAE